MATPAATAAAAATPHGKAAAPSPLLAVFTAAVTSMLMLLPVAPARAAGVHAVVHLPGGAPLEDAALVLEPLSAPAPKGKLTARISQHEREFIPYVSVVQVGTAVEFPNQDPFRHHVYSFSPAKPFEIKLYSGKPSQPVVFDKPGEVVIGCNIHDWMEAYVLVVPTPWFGKTGANGEAAIRNVPAGRYRISLWHPRQKVAVAPREIELGAANADLKFTLDASAREHKPRPAAEAGHY